MNKNMALSFYGLKPFLFKVTKWFKKALVD